MSKLKVTKKKIKHSNKVNFLTQGLLPAVKRSLSDLILKEKLEGTESFEAETNILIAEIETAINKFIAYFTTEEIITVNFDAVLVELSELKTKQSILESDPNTTMGDIPEYRRTLERIKELQKYINTVPTWKLPKNIEESFKIEDVVFYKGKYWESEKDDNMSEPGKADWQVMVN